MTVRILVDNELTSEIPHNNGVKQGCILAPTLFAICAAAMFMHAFLDSPSGVSIRFRSIGSLFNLARLRAQSKCMTTLLHEFHSKLSFRRVNLRLNLNQIDTKVFLTDSGRICHVKGVPYFQTQN